MTNTIHGTSAGASLDFGALAAPEPPAHELVERKICEGYDCGVSFFRPMPPNAKLGEKLCARCRRLERRMEAMENAIPVRQTRNYTLRLPRAS